LCFSHWLIHKSQLCNPLTYEYYSICTNRCKSALDKSHAQMTSMQSLLRQLQEELEVERDSSATRIGQLEDDVRMRCTHICALVSTLFNYFHAHDVVRAVRFILRTECLHQVQVVAVHTASHFILLVEPYTCCIVICVYAQLILRASFELMYTVNSAMCCSQRMLHVLLRCVGAQT
jgi:hypothetical protein